MFHISSYCNLSHMDGRLYHCFCVMLIDCIGFLMRFAYFWLNRMSRSREGLWSPGTSRMRLKRSPPQAGLEKGTAGSVGQCLIY